MCVGKKNAGRAMSPHYHPRLIVIAVLYIYLLTVMTGSGNGNGARNRRDFTRARGFSLNRHRGKSRARGFFGPTVLGNKGFKRARAE